MFIPAVFRHRAFVTLWVGRLLTNVATLTQSIALGWSVYAIARHTQDERHSLFLVGMIGLAQFTPMFLLALVAGETADRYDRRKILFCCGVLQCLCALCFTLLSMRTNLTLWPIFVVAGFFGVSRTFGMPASSALLPALLPREILPKAIGWYTLGGQTGMILGPWLGGVLCAVSPTWANGTACVLYLLASVTGILLLRLPVDARPAHSGASRLVMIREGLAHLRDSKAVLGAISLDLFAVLLGGVTALFPAYARDILNIGPEGFGMLRSSFAAGAGCMTLILALTPIRRRVGWWMLGGVALYGVATLGFAVSRQLSLTLGLLAIAGAADSISVSVRQNLVQMLTPDAMRGRVSAVSGLFINASNELGEFESGVSARWLGPVGSAVLGGVGSIIITGVWARLFPALRRADRLEPLQQSE